MKVEFFKHNIGPEERKSVYQVLDSIFLTTGQVVREFEVELSKYVGVKHAVGVTSCTGALHLSLLALGLGPGDEVITTPLTFVSTTLAIMHTGAMPVWIDVESSTGNIDANLIEMAITEKTKAIVPVHLYGQMCDMKHIRRIADKYNLAVVEDAAHALEGERDGIGVGNLSDAGCFSFYATKSITSGEGGAVVTNSKELADKVKILRMHGINKDAAERYTHRYDHWDLYEIGWKYNMDNIQASLLYPQLKKAGIYWRKRQELFFRYLDEISTIPGVSAPIHLNEIKHGYHLFTIWVDPEKRDRVLRGLQKEGVGVAVNYRSINLLRKFKTIFNRGYGNYPASERIGDSTISLPLYPNLTDEEFRFVIRSLKKAIELN